MQLQTIAWYTSSYHVCLFISIKTGTAELTDVEVTIADFYWHFYRIVITIKIVQQWREVCVLIVQCKAHNMLGDGNFKWK